MTYGSAVDDGWTGFVSREDVGTSEGQEGVSGESAVIAAGLLVELGWGIPVVAFTTKRRNNHN